MSADFGKPRDSVQQQETLFRLAESRFGLTLAEIARRSGISASTLKSWKNGTVMPAWALAALGDSGIPDELLSLVLMPFGKSVVSAGNMDIELLASLAADLDYHYAAARRPESEAGIELSHRERLSLGEIADKLAAVARRQG